MPVASVSLAGGVVVLEVSVGPKDGPTRTGTSSSSMSIIVGSIVFEMAIVLWLWWCCLLFCIVYAGHAVLVTPMPCWWSE